MIHYSLPMRHSTPSPPLPSKMGLSDIMSHSGAAYEVKEDETHGLLPGSPDRICISGPIRPLCLLLRAYLQEGRIGMVGVGLNHSTHGAAIVSGSGLRRLADRQDDCKGLVNPHLASTPPPPVPPDASLSA